MVISIDIPAHPNGEDETGWSGPSDEATHLELIDLGAIVVTGEEHAPA